MQNYNVQDNGTGSALDAFRFQKCASLIAFCSHTFTCTAQHTFIKCH